MPMNLSKNIKRSLSPRCTRNDKRVDYEEVLASVARLETIRFLIYFFTQINWRILLLDLKSEFLNDFLKDDVFVEQSKGFVVKG